MSVRSLLGRLKGLFDRSGTLRLILVVLTAHGWKLGFQKINYDEKTDQETWRGRCDETDVSKYQLKKKMVSHLPGQYYCPVLWASKHYSLPSRFPCKGLSKKISDDLYIHTFWYLMLFISLYIQGVQEKLCFFSQFTATTPSPSSL